MYICFKTSERYILSHLVLILSFFLISSTTLSQTIHTFNNITTRDGLPTHIVNSIIQDTTGFMWIGLNSGLHRYNGYEVPPFKNDRSVNFNYSNNHIEVVISGSGNILWIGSRTGNRCKFSSCVIKCFNRFEFTVNSRNTSFKRIKSGSYVDIK